MLSALAAEVEALTRLINHRQFFNEFVESGAAALAEVEAGRGDEQGAFPALSMQHRYFVVFDALVGKIGLLDPYMADRITRFYVYAKAVQENYDPKSPFHDGVSNALIVKVIENDLQLLHTVITLGQHIATFRSADAPPGITNPFPTDVPPDPRVQAHEPALADDLKQVKQ